MYVTVLFLKLAAIFYETTSSISTIKVQQSYRYKVPCQYCLLGANSIKGRRLMQYRYLIRNVCPQVFIYTYPLAPLNIYTYYTSHTCVFKISTNTNIIFCIIFKGFEIVYPSLSIFSKQKDNVIHFWNVMCIKGVRDNRGTPNKDRPATIILGRHG